MMRALNLFFSDVLANALSFRNLPGVVKYAVLYLIGSWIVHYLSIYIISRTITLEGRYLIQMYVIGPVIGVFIFSMRNWVRIMCMLCQGLGICMYLFLSVGFALVNNQKFGLISGLNLALFSVSIYFLMRKETREYMKARSDEAKEKLQAESESNS